MFNRDLKCPSCIRLSLSYCAHVRDENAPATSPFDSISYKCFEVISTNLVVGLINCTGLNLWSTSTVEATLDVFDATSDQTSSRASPFTQAPVRDPNGFKSTAIGGAQRLRLQSGSTFYENTISICIDLYR